MLWEVLQCPHIAIMLRNALSAPFQTQTKATADNPCTTQACSLLGTTRICLSPPVSVLPRLLTACRVTRESRDIFSHSLCLGSLFPVVWGVRIKAILISSYIMVGKCSDGQLHWSQKVFMGGGRTQAYRNECWLCGVKTFWDPAPIYGGKSKEKNWICEFRPIDVPEESLLLFFPAPSFPASRSLFFAEGKVFSKTSKGIPKEPWEPVLLLWIRAFHAPNPEFSVPA